MILSSNVCISSLSCVPLRLTSFTFPSSICCILYLYVSCILICIHDCIFTPICLIVIFVSSPSPTHACISLLFPFLFLRISFACTAWFWGACTFKHIILSSYVCTSLKLHTCVLHLSLSRRLFSVLYRCTKSEYSLVATFVPSHSHSHTPTLSVYLRTLSPLPSVPCSSFSRHVAILQWVCCR